MSERTSFSRRSLLAAAPAVALIPATALAVQPADPVFAALAEYKRLDAIFGECCGLTDEVAAKNEGREITEAERQIVQAGADASEQAFDKLLNTVPTTLGGLKVFLETVFDESVNYEAVDIAMQTALKSPVFVSV